MNVMSFKPNFKNIFKYLLSRGRVISSWGFSFSVQVYHQLWFTRSIYINHFYRLLLWATTQLSQPFKLLSREERSFWRQGREEGKTNSEGELSQSLKNE